MSIVEGEKERSGACGNVTKSAAKGTEKSGGREGGMCGQAIRSIARRVEEKPGTHLTTEGTGALWREYS